MTSKRKGRPARRPLPNTDASQRKVHSDVIAEHGHPICDKHALAVRGRCPEFRRFLPSDPTLATIAGVSLLRALNAPARSVDSRPCTNWPRLVIGVTLIIVGLAMMAGGIL